MKKKQFRIAVYVGLPNETVKAIVLYAAICNGTNADLDELISYGEGFKSKHESSNDTHLGKIERQLFVDCKVNGIWENAAIIEEVEVFELVREYEDDDKVF